MQNGQRFGLREGLDIPLAGAPEQVVEQGQPVASVALVADDYVGLSASVAVREGDRVDLGQPLFEDRNKPGVLFTSPGSGTVTAVNRDDRGELESIVVRLTGQTGTGKAGAVGDSGEREFHAYASDELTTLDADRVREQLLASGQWTAFRERPFGTVPVPDDRPAAIFVTAIDTNPLAALPQIIIDSHQQAFRDGLRVVSRLTDGRVYVCSSADAVIPTLDDANVVSAKFAGPHPAGLVGTHIHLLAPAAADRTVWHLGYQDVIAIGRLFTSGRLWTERVISLAGPVVRRPRLVKARLGASMGDLVRDELEEVDCRVISGSVLSGRRATATRGHLRRYHVQASVLREHRGDGASAGHAERSQFSFYRWPGWRGRRFRLTTSLHGQPGPMLPLDVFERVMPLDVLVAPLLRALLVGDAETARDLGCLELVEEDLALCSFLCPGKNEYGALLRSILDELDER
jgi:Na+-transporting NADH:ubiquinone oxidoreductase subunit A